MGGLNIIEVKYYRGARNYGRYSTLCGVTKSFD